MAEKGRVFGGNFPLWLAVAGGRRTVSAKHGGDSMYRVEVAGVPEGSDWDIQPSVFPTIGEATEFMLGIGRTLIAMAESNCHASATLTVSVIGPKGVVVTWPHNAVLAAGHLSPTPE
jgi:hypothetical protein